MATNLFGRSYQTVGESSSDYLIKTKGQVKILYGSKFIDLIKDGKLNVDTKFIFLQDEVGSKDGIYVVGDKVVLVSSGNQIDIVGSQGNTYVSFLEKLETTSDQKYTALLNIGFIYQNIELVQNNGPLNGVVYVEETKKLYIILNGQISEYTISFPSLIKKQFIILKDDETQGALVIKGEGLANSLAFDLLYIYNKNNSLYYSSLNLHCFELNGQTKLILLDDKAVFSNKVISTSFETTNANALQGFRVYTSNGETTLEVDNLIVRNLTLLDLKQNEYLTKNNIISYAALSDSNYNVTFYFKNTFNVNDYVGMYRLSNNGKEYQYDLIKFKIESITDEITTLSLVDKDILLSSDEIVNQTLFLIASLSSLILTQTENGFEFSNTTDLENKEKLIKIGNLEDKDTIGIEAKNGYFDNLETTKEIQNNDSSNIVATTKWVNNLLPKGTIILYNNTENIPENWLICDGTNEAPNLSDLFLKNGETILAVYIMKNF